MFLLILLLAAGVQFAATILAMHWLFPTHRGPLRLWLMLLVVSFSLFSSGLWTAHRPAFQAADWLLLHATFPWPLIIAAILAILIRGRLN